MQIITAREFRSNQTKYLTDANNGDSIILTSRQGSFRIVPISRQDTIVDQDLWTAMQDVKAHMEGKKQLANAKDIVF